MQKKKKKKKKGGGKEKKVKFGMTITNGPFSLWNIYFNFAWIIFVNYVKLKMVRYHP